MLQHQFKKNFHSEKSVRTTSLNILRGVFLEKFHQSTLKICRLNNVIFENIPKFQRHYYHGNSKQLNFSIHILYMR